MLICGRFIGDVMKKQSFVFGAVILSLSGIVCKILGAIYKIPLANVLGTQGMGIYYLIFPVYAFLLTFVSSSFTVSISKSVSGEIAKNDKEGAYKIFRASLFLLLLLGGSLCLVLCILSKVISNLQGLDSAYLCYLVIAPAIIAVAVSSAYKGYFQGLQNMVPSAISQVLDQIFKLASGFLLASFLSKKGVVFGTLGALLGVSIAEIITSLFFVIYFYIFKKRHKSYFVFKKGENKERILSLMKKIFIQALPFMLSSVILPMSLVIDSFLIINILKSMGFEKLFATGLLGLNSGIVNTLVNLPSTLSSAICMTIVPYITYSLSKKDYESISNKTSLALKLTILIAIPCFLIFSFFSSYIVKVLYSGSFGSVYEYNVASSLLTLSSINVLYLALLQITTSLLQAINKAYIPVCSLSVSLIFKVVCEVVLINIPYLNIAGAVISNSVCYFISSAVNIYFFRKYITVKSSFVKSFLSPFLSSLVSCLIIFLSIKVLENYVSYTMCVLLSFVSGGIVYLLLIFLFKTFTKEETSALFNFRKKQKT